ncbi:MAG TPA: carboxyl-terminal protease, partial [Chitinophagaceae bacterium]|nr:carboxyl-terminal protease [Chitinophagaceae bacterium]
GGIMPDVFVPIDTATYPSGINRLFANGTFNSFVYTWYLKHRSAIDKFATSAEFVQKFDRLDEVWEQFVTYAKKDSVDLSTVTEKQKMSLQKRLEAYLARFKWRSSGFYHVLNDQDAVISKAREIINR